MRTAEVKAKELVNSFKPCCERHSMNGNDWETFYDNQRLNENSKQCAIIAIDEKIETFLRCCGSEKHFYTGSERDHYNELQEIKTHIKNL